MKESTQVYLFAFAIIAVFAFLLSGVFAHILVIDNSNSTKLTAIENNSFEPHEIEQVQVITHHVANYTRSTNNTTYIENSSNNIIETQDNTVNQYG